MSGTVSNMTLLAIHWLLRDRLLDPTGGSRYLDIIYNFALNIAFCRVSIVQLSADELRNVHSSISIRCLLLIRRAVG